MPLCKWFSYWTVTCNYKSNKVVETVYRPVENDAVVTELFLKTLIVLCRVERFFFFAFLMIC